MKNKSSYEAFFEDTQDIQCITCLDKYMLQYYINDCRIRVEKLYDGRFKVSIIAYDEHGNRIKQNKFEQKSINVQS